MTFSNDVFRWAEDRAQLYQMLTNPRRLLILRALADQELSVSDIAERTETSIQNVSQHLRLMKDRGILECRREGQTIYYFISNPQLLRSVGLINWEVNPEDL